MSTYTYETLNKDIKIVPANYGKYDLDVVSGDFTHIENFESLKNGISVAILTRYGDLS